MSPKGKEEHPFRTYFVDSYGLAVLGLPNAALGFPAARGSGFLADYLEGSPGLMMGSLGVLLIVANLILVQFTSGESPLSRKEDH